VYRASHPHPNLHCRRIRAVLVSFPAQDLPQMQFEEHLAAACKSQRCFNRERPGDRAEQCDMPALCCVCLANGHETSSCPFIYCSSNITGAKPTDKPAEKEKSYSGAAKTGKLVDTARKAEEDISRTK
ncbi:unnamed protein product, partial [Porites lobata]